MEKESRWSLFKQKLHDKYKLTIMNKAFEEKFSLELSKLNVFVIISLSILLLITLTTLLIALTPLKEYIPGYGSTQQNKRLFNLQVQVDSLQHQLNDYEIFIRNMQQVFLEEDFSADSNAFQRKAAQPEKNTTFAFSKEDSLLLNITLQKQEAEGNASTRIEQKNKKKYNMLFQPVFGKLERRYSEQQPAVGILTFRTQPIYAIAEGNVILTQEKGTCCIQHPDNLISIYRNCGQLLVRKNEYVRAGQVIAHTKPDSNITYIELWSKGHTINPQTCFDLE